MSWREELKRGASFRGVPFFVESSEMSGGRRGPVHEYPGKDTPYREDLGREKRTFNVSGFVLGENYFTDRKRLQDALEARGPGVLIHPYQGTRIVSVIGYRVREETREGGLARFEVEFLETGEASQPTVYTDVGAELAASVASMREVAGEDFLAGYEPGIYSAGPAGVLGGTVDAVEGALRGLTLATQDLANVRRRLARLDGEAAALLAAPAGLLAELDALLLLLPGELLAVFGLVPGLRPPAGTANRERERANYDALYALVQRLAVVRAVELASAAEYESFEAATSARDALLGPLDYLLGRSEDAVYGELEGMRAAFVAAVPGEDRGLPHLVEETLAVSIPSLVLTYRLYGSLEQELALVARNAPQRPGYLLGSVEVLAGA